MSEWKMIKDSLIPTYFWLVGVGQMLCSGLGHLDQVQVGQVQVSTYWELLWPRGKAAGEWKPLTLLKKGSKYLKRNSSFEHFLNHPLLGVAVTTNLHWKTVCIQRNNTPPRASGQEEMDFNCILKELDLALAHSSGAPNTQTHPVQKQLPLTQIPRITWVSIHQHVSKIVWSKTGSSNPRVHLYLQH